MTSHAVKTDKIKHSLQLENLREANTIAKAGVLLQYSVIELAPHVLYLLKCKKHNIDTIKARQYTTAMLKFTFIFNSCIAIC